MTAAERLLATRLAALSAAESRATAAREAVPSDHPDAVAELEYDAAMHEMTCARRLYRMAEQRAYRSRRP